jgi:hypothetical protein
VVDDVSLRAKYKLGIKRYLEGAEDAHGNPVEGWGPVEYVDVFAIAPTSSQEPSEPGRAAIIDGLTVLAPDDYGITARDVAVYRDSEYSIEGNVADWNTGAFSFKPGYQFNLKKVEG